MTAFGRLALIFIATGFASSALAVPAFRSSFVSTYASRTNLTLTAPSGIQNGDILIVLFFIGANGGPPPTPTPPAGFSAISGFTPTTIAPTGFQVRSHAWFKVANAESGNYTITHASASSVGYIGAYKGVDTTSPFSPLGTQASGTGNTMTPVAGITTTLPDTLILFWTQDWGDINSALVPPTGTTPTFTTRADASGVSLVYVADGLMTTAGSTGTKSHAINNSSGSGSGWQAGLIALKPACITQPSTSTYRVPNGPSICWEITGPNAVCRDIRNTHLSGLDIMVPGNSTAEWQSFYNNPPSGVTATACP